MKTKKSIRIKNTILLVLFFFFSFSMTAQDYSNSIAYADIKNPPYSSSGNLINYEADYSPIINMAPSIFNWSGSFTYPVKMRVAEVNSNKSMIIDFSGEKIVLQRKTIWHGREKLNQRKHEVICPTDLCIVDMNSNIVFKCNLYWTKTFQVNLNSALKPGFYIICYYDQSGYVTRGIEVSN